MRALCARRCEENGHVSTQCREPKCSQCLAFGYETYEASCCNCAEDHPVYKYRRWTYATAAGFTRRACAKEEGSTQPDSQGTEASKERDNTEIPADKAEVTQDPAANNEEQTEKTLDQVVETQKQTEKPHVEA